MRQTKFSYMLTANMALILFIVGCIPRAGVNVELDRVDIYSLSWGRHAPLSMTPQRIIVAEDALHVTITDVDTLFELAKRIDEVESNSLVDRDHIDGRIACLIHRINSRTDTLTFGQFYMGYNGHYYTTDTTLLRLIGRRLPEGTQLKIEQAIENLGKLQK